MLTCHSSAKVNLTLDVLSRRADGYHELQSVVHTVGLWDTITLEPRPSANGVTLSCNWSELQTDNNLCIKAVRAFRDGSSRMGAVQERVSWSGLHIHLEKRIPLGAGLGGGSGNAAAVLATLNRRNGMPDEELEQIAAALGADVPLFLRGGAVLMEGIGERLTPLSPIEGWLVLVKPPEGCSTPQIYRAWDELNAPSERASRPMLKVWQENPIDLRSVAKALRNDLSRAASACGLDVEARKRALCESGALGAEMTGSGSAVYGVFHDEGTARRAAASWSQAHGTTDFVAVAPLCATGVRFGSTGVRAKEREQDG